MKTKILLLIGTILGFIFSFRTFLPKTLILFSLISGIVLLSNNAKAAPYSGTYRVWPQYGTSSNSGVNHTVTLTPSLDKTSYNPGETITADIAGFSADCDNSYIDYALGMTINGSTSRRGGYYIESDISGSDNKTDARVYAYSKTFTAPSTPGTYSAKFFFEDRRCGGPSAVHICYFDSGVYVGNKTTQVNYNTAGVAPYGTSWTPPQMWTALKNYGGIYEHYNDYHVSENVWGCRANCSVSEMSVNLTYTVVAPASPPPAPTSCNLPWGGSISSGSSVLAYQNSSVPFGNVCVSENRVCNNGILSGTFTNQNCVVGLPPAPPATLTVNLTSSPLSPLNIPVTENNGTIVFGTAQTTLSWVIQNAATICAPLGCSCTLSGPGGNQTSDYSLISSNSYLATLGKGSHNFSITCSKK